MQQQSRNTEFVVVSAKTTPAEKAELRALADTRGTTVSRLVRQLIVAAANSRKGGRGADAA